MAQDMQKAMEQQKLNCPFCKIIKGEIPSRKVFESNRIVAILDINPASEGHVLIMPKEHYPIMPLIPKEVLTELFTVLVRLADMEKLILLKQGTTIFVANGAVAGQQSSHFMVHIIPRDESDLRQLNLEGGDLNKETLTKISGQLSSIMKARLKEEYDKFPLRDEGGLPIALKQTYSKDYVIAIIERNPQLKEALIAQPEEFKAAVPVNPQLRTIFEGLDVDDIIRHFVPSFGDNKEDSAEKEENTNEVKKSPDKEQKPDLDLISGMFK